MAAGSLRLVGSGKLCSANPFSECGSQQPIDCIMIPVCYRFYTIWMRYLDALTIVSWGG
jgi:hypothetical protein